tara:strand:- start:1124 stop:2566 length:1443 start_codon:yes stop_codon:yes gene_type:complete
MVLLAASCLFYSGGATAATGLTSWLGASARTGSRTVGRANRTRGGGGGGGRFNRTAARQLKLLLHPDRAEALAGRTENRTRGARFNRTAVRELKGKGKGKGKGKALRSELAGDAHSGSAASGGGGQSLPPPRDLEAVAGSCKKSTVKNQRKAATRMRICQKPEVAAASNATVPLLWSRQLRRSQEQFVNEKPFATRKFDPFLEQLPETSSLLHTWNGGCDACDTCAVVGASGSLLNRAHGRLIDAHDVVFRPNWIRIKGYEQHVGTRTHVNLFFGVEGMIDQFEKVQLRLPAEQRAVGLVTSASDRSVASFFRHMVRIRKNQTQLQQQGVVKPQVYLMSDHIYHKALARLCGATGGGCEWLGDRSSTMRPSTGFLSVIIALQICRRVSVRQSPPHATSLARHARHARLSRTVRPIHLAPTQLFGLSTDPCRPFHYYGDPKPPGVCTPDIPKENDERVHWFDKEHELYEEWRLRGLLTTYS